MSQPHQQHPHHEGEGGPRAARAGERRGNERRRLERRAPPPPWRRPWALVSYGVVGALTLVLLFDLAGGREDDAPAARDEALVEKQPSGSGTVADDPNPAAAASGPEDAYGAAGFTRLVTAGEEAVGKVVRAELFCEPVQNFTVIQGHTAPSSVASMIREGSVPAARCRWGADEPRSEVLLLVPPALAEQFASTPVVKDGFVDRRHVYAELEWVGKRETLALRTAGVLRGMVEPRPS